MVSEYPIVAEATSSDFQETEIQQEKNKCPGTHFFFFHRVSIRDLLNSQLAVLSGEKKG